MRARSLGGILVALSIFAGPAWCADDAGRDAAVRAILPDLEKLAGKYRRATHTPGLAIAVVTPDRMYFLNSGRRRISSSERVSESTVFQVASVSKPITGTYVARLVTENKLKWNARITELLPWFRFASPHVTSRVTVLDMLTQRSGLVFGAGAILEDLGYGQRVVLEQMRFVDPSPRFRQKWNYVNFGITLGGIAAARTTPWNFPTSIRHTLFGPLGMANTTASYAEFLREKDRAQMNYVLDGRAAPIFVRDAQAQAPGGGVSGTSRDLGKLLQMYLNGGLHGGKRFLSPAALEKVISPITPTPLFRDGVPIYYGVGWEVTMPKGGPKTVSHGGSFAGVRTLVSFRPDNGIGIVVLGNAFFGLPPEAIESAFYQLYDTGRVKKHTLQKTLARGPDLDAFLGTIDDLLETSPVLPSPLLGQPLSAYVGVYANAYLGPFVVAQTADGLSLTVGPNQAPMPIKLLNGTLYVLNKSGDFFPLDFTNFDAARTRFDTLHMENADDVGWGVLSRVP